MLPSHRKPGSRKRASGASRATSSFELKLDWHGLGDLDSFLERATFADAMVWTDATADVSASASASSAAAAAPLPHLLLEGESSYELLCLPDGHSDDEGLG